MPLQTLEILVLEKLFGGDGLFLVSSLFMDLVDKAPLESLSPYQDICHNKSKRV